MRICLAIMIVGVLTHGMVQAQDESDAQSGDAPETSVQADSNDAKTPQLVPVENPPKTNVEKVIQAKPKRSRRARTRRRYREKRTDGTRAIKRLDGRSILKKSFYHKDGRALDVDFN